MDATCQAIASKGARAGETAIGILAGRPSLDQASCTIRKEAEFDQGAIEILELHRICAGTPKTQGTCSDQRSCMVFDIGSSKDDEKTPPILPKLCVYKEGDHPCPKENYLEKTLIHRGLQDKRSCAPCQVEHEKGELRCLHTLGLSSRDQDLTCQDLSPINPQDLCLTEEDFLGRLAPWSLVEIRREVRYAGHCQASEPEVRGKVDFLGTVTLCCHHSDE